MGGAADGGLTAQLIGFAPIIGIFILFYFLLIRPQQKRAKEHATAIAAVKRGDTVVLGSGMIGKVTRVEEGRRADVDSPQLSCGECATRLCCSWLLVRSAFTGQSRVKSWLRTSNRMSALEFSP